MPAWSSDGGSAQENGDAAGADDMREDDMPLCDERAGVDVVDLHELAPHETPTPLPVGVWSQAAEQAAEVDLGSHRLQQLPCERPQLGLQPVCELTPHKTPKLSSGVKSQPGDDGAQVELDGHQIPVVLEDAERGMPSTPKFCEGVWPTLFFGSECMVRYIDVGMVKQGLMIPAMYGCNLSIAVSMNVPVL